MSPDYVVFRTDPQTLLPGFLDQVRHSQIWERFIYSAGSGSVRIRIYFSDLARMQIPLPPIAEQRRIANALDTADREIALLSRLGDVLANQRRGIMQRILSGDLEIPPDPEGDDG